jgi:O-antigen ligase
LETPDWLLLTCFLFAIAHFLISGGLVGLLTDFNFMIAYFAGRVTVLSSGRERLWAKRAVWIVAIVAVLGMVEVFFIGEAPRTLLYLSLGGSGTQNGALDNAFHGTSYTGLRESATMFGPLQFAPLCMAALVLWWVYCRNPVPAAMIGAGLICSLTRSAWVGSAAAISVLAVRMDQTRRLLRYGALLAAMFVVAIPLLGLSDYLFSVKSGEDPSAQGHRISILEGLRFVAQHPMGTGPGSVGRWAVRNDTNALGIENTYLTIAGEYGVAALLCFVGFLVSCVRKAWRQRTRRSYTAIGLIVGFAMVMMFAALHDVFPLACWLWFPVGLAIRSVSEPQSARNPTEIPTPDSL